MTDWDSILDQMDYEDQVKRDARFDEDPDRVARVSRAADATGLPVDAADRNLDEIEAEQRMSSLDLGKIFDEQPATGRLIRENGAIAHDEIEDLRDTEERIGTASNLARTFGDRLSDIGSNVLQAFGTLATPIEQSMEDYFGGVPAIRVSPSGIHFTMATAEEMLEASPARRLARTLEDVDLGSETRFSWDELKQEPSLGNLAGYVGEAGAASLADMLVAMTGSVGLASYVAGRSQEMAEGRAENIYGREVDATMLMEVLPAAIAEASLERIGGRSILDVGGVRTGGQAARAAGRALFREGATEFVQENIDYAATTAGTDVDMSLLEAADRGFAAMVAGAGMGTAIRGTTASIELGISKLNRSTNEQAIIDEMMGIADRTKLKARDVRAYQNYMQDLAQTYGVETVSIDADAEYFQANPDSPLLDNIVGDDVQVDVAEFMTLDSQIREALRPDMRLHPDSASQVEIESFDTQADIQQMIETAQESVKEFTRAQEIYRQVADQLNATGAYGRFTSNLMAHLYPAYVVTKAKNEGLTVDEVWEQLGVSFVSLDAPVEQQGGETILDQSASLRRGTQTLRKYGLEPGKTHKTRDVAAALEARQRDRYGYIDRNDRSPAALRKISKWMVEEVVFELEEATGASGVGWYSEKFQAALDTFGGTFPELKTDQNARDQLTALIAITSDGQKVVPNFAQAIDIYSNFRETGQFTTERGHIRQASIDGNLARLQQLYDGRTPEEVREYLLAEDTVSNLRKDAAEKGLEFNTDYQAHMTLPRSALVFGPKLGAFYANLMGSDGYLTMDRWWTRTFNRYRGSLLQSVKGLEDNPTDAQGKRIGLARFKDIIGEPEMSDDQALSRAVDLRNSYEAKGFKRGTDAEKAANTIYKAAFENIEDAPFNSSDRTFMIDAVNAARKTLKRKGVEISVADIQAVLWYYEKRLYGELGARQTADISYEEAAQRVSEGYQSEGRSSQSGLAEGVSPGEDVFQEGQVDGTATEADAGAVRDGGGVRGSPRVLEQSSGPDSRFGEPLSGLPTEYDVDGESRHFGAYLPAHAAAQRYADAVGLDYEPISEYAALDRERATRIAQAFEEAEHRPDDPQVQAAYAAMIDETLAQYQAALDAGLTVDFIQDQDPYTGNPRKVMLDVYDNNHMWVYSTREGFGSDAEFDPSGNPMLAETEFDIGGQKALVNDIFRVVHDYFGHVKDGVGFRARGEENAWRSHASMYSPLALQAMTTETRGQNSWVNFGPYGETNRTASAEETVYADQKMTLLPRWVATEGLEENTFNQSPTKSELGLYSAVEKAALEMNIPGWADDKPVNAQQAYNKLIKTQGVKAEEIEWLGLEEFMASGKVTKTEVVEFIRNNGVVVDETIADEATTDERDIEWDETTVSFEDAEGEDYIADRVIEELDPNYGSELDSAISAYILENDADLDPEGVLSAEEITEQKTREEWSEILLDDEQSLEMVRSKLRVYYYQEPMYRYTWEAGDGTEYEILGSDDRGYDISRDGNQEEFAEVYSVSEAQIRAAEIITNNGHAAPEDDASVAKWEDYVTPGAYQNYREVKLTLPEIEGNYYNETHFPDRNLVAFLRVTDRKLKKTESSESFPLEFRADVEAGSVEFVNGDTGEVVHTATGINLNNFNAEEINQRVAEAEEGQRFALGIESDGKGGARQVSINSKDSYFIDEMQSDWHQDGRQEGYRGNFSEEAITEAGNKLRRRRMELDKARQEALREERLPEGFRVDGRQYEGELEFVLTDEDTGNRYVGPSVSVAMMSLPDGILAPAQDKAYREARQDLDAMRSTIPDAPFKKDEWQRLALKRALVQAAEQGAESFAWVDSDAVIDRWSDRYANLYITQYDKKMPSMVKKLTGQKPVRVKDGIKDGVGYWSVPITDELRAKITGEGLPLFQPGNEGNRGNISLFPDQAVIRLGLASDQSTFFHESGHLFLEMERRFAESPNATDRQKADFQTILNFLEVESADQIGTEQHEKFARAFESYIGEGKAPSLELRTAFRRFAQWIVRIYRTLTALDVELNDDIRGVMDRMLATEEQIERAAASFAFDMTAFDEESNGKEKAKETLRTKLIKAIKREKDRDWKVGRARIAERIEQELADEPVYQAMEILKDLPVDRASVVELLGVKNLQKVPQMRGLTIKDGENVDDAAQLLGYPSGQAMIEAIMSAPKIKDEAMDRAQQAMLEKHGDPMVEIEALADQAMHNEEMATQLLAELRALNPRQQKIDKAPIREYAKDYIGSLRTIEIKPLTFQRAEVKAARAYERALAEGDTELALQHKQNQILQFYLVREAMAAEKKIERMRKTLKGYQDREYRDTEVAPEYAQNLRTYARMYDFRKGQGSMQDMLLVESWVRSQIEDENQFIKPQVFDLVMIRLRDSLQSGEQFVMPSWRDMTLDEFSGVHDQAKHFRWLGGQMSDRARAQRKAEAGRLAESIEDKSTREVVKPDVIRNLDRNKSIIKRFMADHLRLRNVASILDGGTPGIAKAKLYDPLAEAANNEVDMNMALAKDVEALFKPLETKLFRRGKSLRTVITESGKNWTLGLRERIMLTLYWGSKDSRQAIMDGHNVTEGDVQRMMDNLSNEELDLVEGIWKLNDSLWPKFSAVTTRLYGAAPTKVTNESFTVRNRDMPGGYMRLFYEYDPKDSSRADLHETAQDVFKGGTSISMSKPGSAHARVGSGGRRVSLELNNITMALEENVHSIAFGEVSRDVARLAKDKGVAAAIIKGHGEERYQALIDTLDGIVSGDLPGSTGIEKWMRYVRTNLTFGYLAFSIRNFVQQPVALTNVFGKVGEVRAVSAMLSVMRRPKYWMQFASERSTFMRHRLAFVNREAAEQLSHISTNSTNSWLKRHSFDLQTLGDSFVAYPAWVAGYREGLEIYADEAKAISHADDIVAATVGSGMVKDLSPILMGGGGVGKRLGKEAVKQLTFMGSFFNVVYNLVDESYRKTNFKSPKQVAEFSREMAWYLVAPALLSKVVVSSLWGEDEDEGFWEWSAKAVGEYGLGSVFLLRDLASALNGFKPSVPFQSAPAGLARGVSEIGELIEEGEVNAEDIPAMIRSMQPLLPLPGSGQVARFLDYTNSHGEGNEGDFNIYDALVEGKERDK